MGEFMKVTGTYMKVYSLLPMLVRQISTIDLKQTERYYSTLARLHICLLTSTLSLRVIVSKPKFSLKFLFTYNDQCTPPILFPSLAFIQKNQFLYTGNLT